MVPFQVIGQGNRAGPVIWALISAILLNILSIQGFGLSITCALSWTAVAMVGFAFVDDTDHIHMVSSPDPIYNLSFSTNSQVKKGSPLRKELNEEKEEMIEEKVSDHLEGFSFAVIPDLDEDYYRLELESKLISTVNKGGMGSSDNWLGLSHPNKKIVLSGLWNIQHLDDSKVLSSQDFDFIKERAE